MDNPRIPSPFCCIDGLCSMPPGTAKPLHEALQNDLSPCRRKTACPRRSMLPMPSNDFLERHPGNRLVQTPLEPVSQPLEYSEQAGELPEAFEQMSVVFPTSIEAAIVSHPVKSQFGSIPYRAVISIATREPAGNLLIDTSAVRGNHVHPLFSTEDRCVVSCSGDDDGILWEEARNHQQHSSCPTLVQLQCGNQIVRASCGCRLFELL